MMVCDCCDAVAYCTVGAKLFPPTLVKRLHLFTKASAAVVAVRVMDSSQMAFMVSPGSRSRAGDGGSVDFPARLTAGIALAPPVMIFRSIGIWELV